MFAIQRNPRRLELIDRNDAELLPSDHCPPERSSPWWHQDGVVAKPGARVLIAFRGKRCVIWQWARVVAALGVRASVVIQTAGPPDHRVLPGHSLQITPSLHVHIALNTQADVRALEAWHREMRDTYCEACVENDPQTTAAAAATMIENQQ